MLHLVQDNFIDPILKLKIVIYDIVQHQTNLTVCITAKGNLLTKYTSRAYIMDFSVAYLM